MISSLNRLLLHLINKYKIRHSNILGHSDIAPYRKIDPGKKFPWSKLTLKNNFLTTSKKNKFLNKSLINKWLNKKIKSKKRRITFMLAYIGYDVEPSIDSNKKFKILISAYQMRYNQRNINGNVDEQTFNLIIKHYINKILNF